MKKCHHPNMIALREELKHKRDTASVFPAYDMDLRKLLGLRRETPDEFPSSTRQSILSQMWLGLAYLHSSSIVHRDIKPANILIRLGMKVVAVLADMGLAVDISVPSIVAGYDGLGELTAGVCSGGYIAPELLIVRRNLNESAAYGLPVDVWSAAVVTWEIYSLGLFIGRSSSTGDEMRIIACRLGKPPTVISGTHDKMV